MPLGLQEEAYVTKEKLHDSIKNLHVIAQGKLSYVKSDRCKVKSKRVQNPFWHLQMQVALRCSTM